MEIITPNAQQIEIINQMRQHDAARIAQAGTLEGPLQVSMGPCAPDSNRHPEGDLATVRHILYISEIAGEDADLELVARLNGVKPRTLGGTTGLIHQPNGPRTYTEAARLLTDAGVPLAAEIMDESDAAVAGPWLTRRWIGARTLEDSGARQLARPTQIEIDAGLAIAPAFVKSPKTRDLQPAINALHVIRAEKPEIRTRLTLHGPEQVKTLANPHTGLILRGFAGRPDGPLDEIMGEQIVTARGRLDSEFGKNAVALWVDTSHQHAAWEGGGEAGQLAIAASLGRLMADHGIIIDGVMAETYLLPDKQADNGTVPGLSQVDKCISQSNTVRVMGKLSAARARQQLALSTSLQQ